MGENRQGGNDRNNPADISPAAEREGVWARSHIRAVGQWQHPRPSWLPTAASETPSAAGLK